MSSKVMKNSKFSPKDKRKKKLVRQAKEIIDTEEKTVSDVIGNRSALRRTDENDPSWYARSPQLLRDAFSISTAERLGLPFKCDVPDQSATAFPFSTTTTYVVPGVFNLLLLPVPGISINANSAVNAAAKKLFAQVRRANSGYSNYEPTDLMLYLLAIDNIYMLWNWLTRLYGIINLYSSRNAYLPEGLLYSMNVNRSILKDYCQLRGLINQLQSKINTFCVPSYLTYFTRHSWLFSNIWMDSNNAKAQLYLLNPHSLYQWVEQTTLTEPAYLKPIALSAHSTTAWSLESLQDLVNDMLNPIYYSDDFALISGDIEKSFGRGNCFTVPTIEEHFVVIPTYSPEVLTQISNAKSCQSAYYYNSSLADSFRITQAIVGTGDLATSSIVCNPSVVLNYNSIENSSYLYNFHTDDVTPEVAAVATRLNLVPNLISAEHTANSDSIAGELASCSSEIVLAMETITFNPGNQSYGISPVPPAYYAPASGLSLTNLRAVASLTQFDWSPLVKVSTSSGDVHFIGDLDNYTLVSHQTLSSMNDVALLSMFGIPGTIE